MAELMCCSPVMVTGVHVHDHARELWDRMDKRVFDVLGDCVCFGDGQIPIDGHARLGMDGVADPAGPDK
jgi:nitrogenase subunit NifH